MTTILKGSILVVLVLCGFTSSAQQDMQMYFSAIASEQSTIPFTFDPAIGENRYIQVLSPYLKDTLLAVRSEAYHLVSRLGQSSKQTKTRKEVVKILLKGWRDKDTGINGQVANALFRFSNEDFDKTVLEDIRELNRSIPYSGKLFKLIGKLDIRDQLNIIKTHLQNQQTPLSRQDVWSAYVAMARMGDVLSEQTVMDKANKLGSNDDTIYELYPDLIYIGSRTTIDFLVKELYGEENNCSSPDAESERPINCAYRVMEILAPVIKDYPVAVSASGDLVEKDYPKALATIRAWFNERNGNYTIVKR
ncbi:hypothetical protein [Ohtaekwangia koreensis]|uniref:HEAT repeat-containing protein n=1 Tax=Ohtaekwangia koreensis TaxID=688867 RepID=A0A1T5M0Q6_9BACT|nr:hypothetical protein [Ohtaekwangia koreensis]SKC81634.1 hypothetical protein SAMN05660236_3989 [Ohtaekwangia koreensis]